MGRRGEDAGDPGPMPEDRGTHSNPAVVQSSLPGITLSYDFIVLKSYTDPIAPLRMAPRLNCRVGIA